MLINVKFWLILIKYFSFVEKVWEGVMVCIWEVWGVLKYVVGYFCKNKMFVCYLCYVV